MPKILQLALQVRRILLAFALLSCPVIGQVQLITFDDEPCCGEPGTPPAGLIPNGYKGLNWSDVGVTNPSLGASGNGYLASMISSPKVAYNGYGLQMSFSTPDGSKFTWSAYITSIYRDGMNIDITGSNQGNVAYQATITPSATSPTPYTFNQTPVDTVTFSASGGTLHPGYVDPYNQPTFGMDNLTITRGCQVNVTPWSQCQGSSGHWGGDQYNSHIGTTMCQLGCTTTSLAMSLAAAGVSSLPGAISGFVVLDPGSLNTFMVLHGGDYDSSHDVQIETTTLDVNFGTLALRGGKAVYFDDSLNGDQSLSDLKSAVCQNHAVIVKVAPVANCSVLPGPPGGHYVLVTGEHDDSIGNPHFDIVDPGCVSGSGSLPPITSLDTYNNNFEIRGFVSDPTDVSTLEVSTDDNADLLITDALGSQAGFNPSTGTIKKDIARSSYSRDFLTDNDTGQPASGITHSINLFQPVVGGYDITVTGLKLGTYNLFLSPFATDGTPQPRSALVGITAVGSTASFSVQYSSSASGTSNVTVVATFQSTLADIANSLQLGLIDRQGIADSLTAEIKVAADAIAFGNQHPKALSASKAVARAVLDAFKFEVNAEAGKHITGVAVQVLLQDADSLISQNQ